MAAKYKVSLANFHTESFNFKSLETSRKLHAKASSLKFLQTKPKRQTRMKRGFFTMWKIYPKTRHLAAKWLQNKRYFLQIFQVELSSSKFIETRPTVQTSKKNRIFFTIYKKSRIKTLGCKMASTLSRFYLGQKSRVWRQRHR